MHQNTKLMLMWPILLCMFTVHAVVFIAYSTATLPQHWATVPITIGNALIEILLLVFWLITPQRTAKDEQLSMTLRQCEMRVEAVLNTLEIVEAKRKALQIALDRLKRDQEDKKKSSCN